MGTALSARIVGILAGWLALVGLGAALAQGPDNISTAEMVRIKASADVWLADGSPRERNSSAGKSPQLKLRNIQDLALIRFDAKDLRGREVLDANLYLHRAGEDKLRYLRVSTVNQDWDEGEGQNPLGPANGATFAMANGSPGVNRPWAWTGSAVSDVVMSSGNTLGCWSERKELENGWIAVPLAPALIHALAIGDTDGLAVMDGGNPANQNNLISSAQVQGYEPYLEVRLGAAMTAAPAQPAVTAQPAPGRAHLRSGAIRVSIDPAENVFCWRADLDGRPVARWRVRHPSPGKPTVFFLDDLAPNREHQLDIVGVSPGGQASPATRLKVRSSKTLGRDLALGVIEPLRPMDIPPLEAGPLRVWPLPGLVKVDPVGGQVMCNDLGTIVPREARADLLANAVWNGKQVSLFGARGEYVSFQLCVENLSQAPLTGGRVRVQTLLGPDKSKIEPREIEVYRNWYARNRLGNWQPAYCVPLHKDGRFAIPDEDSRIPDQQNQTLYVDIYVPKTAKPGAYVGSLVVAADNDLEVEIPVTLDVLDLTLPDRLSFWPELNAFQIPERSLEHYRLAHQHRCVLNCWAWRPRLSGSGRDVQVHWDEYDRCVGPLLTGEAFSDCRRSGVPIECMYLPFEDSWPTPLSKQTYRYEGYWPKQGDDPSRIVEHYLTAPPIADALNDQYKEAFQAVQRQFIEHFQARGYGQTEMQCFFGSKVANRTDYGLNTWWTTDEPYYWDDWMALQHLLRLWVQGRGQADPRNWAARADISRPQWQGRALQGLTDTVYYGAGGFNNAAMVRRCRTLGQDTGLNVRAYGSASHDCVSNTENVTSLLAAWADGADAFLPWQILGTDASLDDNDAGTAGGSALLVPGDRFGLPALADLRLKAMRDGQQLIEYLTLLAERRRMSREQLKAMIHEATRPRSQAERAVLIDEADAIQFASLSAWQIQQLRRRVADLLLR